jgi:hypothetical protein
MLHIHNGDSTAGTARKTAIPGDHLAWREALVCGPAPGDLPPAEFRRVRAEHLAAAYGANLEECTKELRKQDDALARFSNHEEVVLWFEHDLFCQIHLVYLLNWFERIELGRTKLSLICIREFPSVTDFRGLGQLNEPQLASLFPSRREVTKAQLELGARSWNAYSSSNPMAIEALISDDTAALPFLGNALTKHLQRFPSTRNGLGRIENVGLELIAGGHNEFTSLFPVFGKREPEYGYGDSQVFVELKRLASAARPLLLMTDGDQTDVIDASRFAKTSFQVTEFGKAVLNGDEDFVRSNGIDDWLGGVHLQGEEAAWRWDEVTQTLVGDPSA